MKKRFDKQTVSRNLDQLQWLQNNARVYMMGLMLLTMILAAAFWLSMEPWRPQGQFAFWDNDSDQAVAEQQVPVKTTSEEQQKQTQSTPQKQQNQQSNLAAKETVEPLTDSQKETNEEKLNNEKPNEENTNEDGMLQQERIPIEPENQTVNLLTLQEQLSGFTAPCSGKLVYGFGVGYDPTYDDYRFHDALCYQADKAEAFAAADGVVQSVDLNEAWQVTLQCGDYRICYGGLQSCKVVAGDAVTGGQSIGISKEHLLVKAER